MNTTQKAVGSSLRSRLLLAGTITAALVLVGSRVLADDAADIESFYQSFSSFVQYDDFADPGTFPVVTAVGSQPITLGGHAYTGWSVFVQDETGSLDLFTSAATLAALPGAPSTFNVGDGLSVGAQWGPFHQIPEISLNSTPASNNFVTTESTGNALPTKPVFNISQLAATGTAPSNSLGIAGFYLEVDNVTITATNGLTTLPGYVANVAPTINQETFTISDNTGSMTMFDWVTSYSAADQLMGTAIGGGNTYNAYGFVSFNSPGGPLEFTPLALVAVPEPSTVVLVATGLVGVLAMRRRRS